ncbi:MAG: polysaccharide deacetylase family protein [bacterium]
MPEYQRYYRYQDKGSVTNSKLVRWLVYIIVLFVIILLIRACLGGGGKQTEGELTNESTEAEQVTDENSNTNSSDQETDTKASIATVESFDVASQCDGIISLYGSEPKIALTFGGRGSGANVDEILKILSDSGVPGSFFFTGVFARNNPEVVTKINQAGFRVYNQSDSHPDFEDLTEDEMLQELELADEEISKLTGLTTKPFFRPPYGSVTEAIADVVISAGYCSVTWTVDALDWSSGVASSEVYDRVMERAQDGAIVLMHIGSDPLPSALPDIITDLRTEGYELVSLADLVGS